MKSFTKNRTLKIALGFSLLVHAALLAVRFAPPDAFKFRPADPGLEVILVNAKHDKKPLKAEALAQANLDGGGNADAGRAKSPLPDMRRSEDGDSLKEAQKRAEALEESQRKMLAQLTKKTPFAVAPMKEVEKPFDIPQPDGADAEETAKALKRREAEIAKDIEDYNKRPKKTQITPSTKGVGYAMYYKALQNKIEKLGTVNFPHKNGKQMYGELVVSIALKQDGTIYEKEGVRVERSSGNEDLDNAALRIVRRSAPFGKIPDNLRSVDRDDVWEIVTRFNFTREGALEAELRGGK
ncbi:TonB family protein [soil metagenome]